LFEVFSQRYERGSTIVTSNLPFEEWTSAAQDRLRRQAFASDFLNAASAQILRRQPNELAVLVQPLRHRLQLATDLVFGEEIE